MKCRIAPPRIAAPLIISVLALSLFHFPQSQSEAANLSASRKASKSSIQAKTIERTAPSGEVSARLQITPATAAGEFRLEMKDFESRIPVKASGAIRISEGELLVRIKESRNGTRLELRAETDQDIPAQAQVTLSLNRLSFKFIVDERVQALVNNARRLKASGASDAEVVSSVLEISRLLQINTGYRPFVEQVKSSAAFDVLSKVGSLIATLPSEEIESNLALLIIRSTVRLFVPSPIHNGIVGRSVIGDGRIIRASHTKNVVYPVLNSTLRPHPVQDPCMFLFLECMNFFNCGGNGQPIDTLCFLGCAGLLIGCEYIT